MPQPIQQLIKKFTRDPVNVRIEAQTMDVPAIEQVYYEVDRRSKLEVLCRLIDLQDIKYALIFCATKMMCDELTEHLIARGYSADKLHGDMTQPMRERVMAKFRKRGIEFLVATDVAARGLDVDDIEVVFNYDLPQDAEDYVHRIGRTGRAGRDRAARSRLSPGARFGRCSNISRFTKGQDAARARAVGARRSRRSGPTSFFETLRETLEKGEYKRHDALIDRTARSRPFRHRHRERAHPSARRREDRRGSRFPKTTRTAAPRISEPRLSKIRVALARQG